MKQDRVVQRGNFELNSFHWSVIVAYCRAMKFFIFPQLFKKKVNGSLQWINLYPVDSTKKPLGFPNTYPLNSDLPIQLLNIRDLNRTSQSSLYRSQDSPCF